MQTDDTLHCTKEVVLVIYSGVDMSGYEITDEDIEAIDRWLSVNHPENANQDYAKGMLVKMKSLYRQVGFDNPDHLEDLYRDYSSDQNGKTSEE